MPDNMLFRLQGKGGIDANELARQRALQKEAEMEAMYQQQREAERQAMFNAMPNTTPQPSMSIADYIRQSRGIMPQGPVRVQPATGLGSVPGFQNLLARLGLMQQSADPQIAQQMSQSLGPMALNNQRIRARLDDQARLEARNRMLGINP